MQIPYQCLSIKKFSACFSLAKDHGLSLNAQFLDKFEVSCPGTNNPPTTPPFAMDGDDFLIDQQVITLITTRWNVFCSITVLN